jgi:hypothetical protein
VEMDGFAGHSCRFAYHDQKKFLQNFTGMMFSFKEKPQICQLGRFRGIFLEDKINVWKKTFVNPDLAK